MRRYQLFVKIHERWAWQCDIESESSHTAFRKAMMSLKPEHYAKPIRIARAERFLRSRAK